MLTIQDIFDRVILRSGQFILNKNNIEINVDNFRLLLEDALALYNDASPYDQVVTIDFRGNRNFIFPSDYGTLNRPPDWISEAHPIGGYGGFNLGNNRSNLPGFGTGHLGNGPGASNLMYDPIQSPWIYDEITKTLTVSHADYFKVTIVNDHIIEIDAEGNYFISTVTNRDQILLQLIQGMFLKGIGRSRRAFTLNDLPILMDAGDLVSEGKELVDEALTKMNNIQKFRLASGG